MNQLNKLIEQWGESKNSPSAASSFKSMIAYEYENGGSPWLDFINFILASRPTCGIEQRLFLDELREKGKIFGTDDPAIEVGEWTQISQSDFTKCNLKELVNE